MVRGSGEGEREEAPGVGEGQRPGRRPGGASLSSSASPRSSGTHTGKLPELCTSETPEREREHRRAGSTSFHFYARPSTCRKNSDR